MPPHPLTPQAHLFDCAICLEMHKEDVAILLDPCGHELCKDSVKRHISVKLAEHRFPILCPICIADKGNGDPGSVYTAFLIQRSLNVLTLCTSVVNNSIVQLVGITGREYEIWEELVMEEFSIPLHCRE